MPAAAELIAFPDPVDLAITAIKTALATIEPDIDVVGRVPEARPAEFIRVRRVGGNRESLISRQVTLTVEGYAQTETRAGRLCELGAAALYAQDAALFGGYEIAGPADLPDPVTTQDRTTATVGIRVRGTAV